MSESIIVALIAIIPSLLAGLFLLINTKLNKRMDKVLTQTKENDIFTVENNILENIIPIFESKDEALDRIADIIAEDKKLRDLRDKSVDSKLDQLALLAEQKCQAPALILEIHRLKDLLEAEEVNRAVLLSLIADENDVEN